MYRVVDVPINQLMSTVFIVLYNVFVGFIKLVYTPL